MSLCVAVILYTLFCIERVLLGSPWYRDISFAIVFVNSLRPRQNRRHLADDVFKCNFLNENVWIPIKISLKFVPKSPINNIPTLVQIMAGRLTGDKPLSEPMMAKFNGAYMRHSASMSNSSLFVPRRSRQYLPPPFVEKFVMTRSRWFVVVRRMHLDSVT